MGLSNESFLMLGEMNGWMRVTLGMKDLRKSAVVWNEEWREREQKGREKCAESLRVIDHCSVRESWEVRFLISLCSDSVCRAAVSLKDLGGTEGGGGGGVRTVVLLQKKKAHDPLTLLALSGSHYRVDRCTPSLPPHDPLPSLLLPVCSAVRSVWKKRWRWGVGGVEREEEKIRKKWEKGMKKYWIVIFSSIVSN